MASLEESPTWTILYHTGTPGFKGRAEFLRLILEDAGVTDYRVTNANLYGPTGLCDIFRGGADNVAALDNAPFPLVFPPAIWHQPPAGREEVMINQTNACMVYLGSQLGYAPASDAERARMDCITGNALDCIASGRLSFHPVEATGGYLTQKEEADRVSKVWAETKLPVWLQHFEKIAKRTDGKPLAGGTGLTCADFAVFHVIDAAEAQFNTEYYGMAWDTASVPHLKAFKKAMASRPNLIAYFASDRRMPWGGDSMM